MNEWRLAGDFCCILIAACAGFCVGYVWGDNFAAIPKKTRKTRKPKTLEDSIRAAQEAIGETK